MPIRGTLAVLVITNVIACKHSDPKAPAAPSDAAGVAVVGADAPPAVTPVDAAPPARTGGPTVAKLDKTAAAMRATWLGTESDGARHLKGNREVRIELKCVGAKPTDPHVAVTQQAATLAKPFGALVGKLSGCDAATRCCTFVLEPKLKTSRYVDQVCFDDSLQVVRVVTTDEDGCRG